MSKYRIATIVGTRPELIRLSRIIHRLDESFSHTLIHTGQNFDYELNQIFFEDLDIREPDIYTNSAGETVVETIANIIKDIDNIFERKSFDGVLILGDTNSSLSAISAKRRKIPIFHMEAGNRCFDMRVPEEINRKIVDHISDINLPYSQIARQYLINEGLKPDQIIVTGSPMMEVLNHYSDKINDSKILKDLKLQKDKYFVISSHREENVDSEEKLSKLVSLINDLYSDYKKDVIISLHPRTKKRIQSLNLSFSKQIKVLKPLSFTDYVRLQVDSYCTLSDSGTITEESSIMNFRSINIRDAHERPEGFEEGAVMFSGIDYERIQNCLSILDLQGKEGRKIVTDYNVPNVSDKIVKIIQSYIAYINEFTWRK